MSGQSSATTRTEALQKITGRDSCPCLIECGARITKGYFARICIAPGYVKCHHLAKMMGELKAPLEWLQRLAIKQDLVRNIS